MNNIISAYDVLNVDRVIGNVLPYRQLYLYVKRRVSVSCYYSPALIVILWLIERVLLCFYS